MSCRRHQLASADALKYIYEAFLLCVNSLLQCLRVRIRAQIFRPELGSVRFPHLLHLVAHLPINTNLLTLYVSVFIRQNILNSSLSWSKGSEANPWYTLPLSCFEALLCFLLCFLNYFTQIVPFFFLSEAVAQRCS